MRMDPGNNTLNAAEVINTYNEHDLARILRVYGEEKFASQIAREIVRRREHERLARRAAHRAHEAQLNRPEPDEDNYEEDEE